MERLFIQALAPEDVVALSVATRPDCPAGCRDRAAAAAEHGKARLGRARPADHPSAERGLYPAAATTCRCLTMRSAASARPVWRSLCTRSSACRGGDGCADGADRALYRSERGTGHQAAPAACAARHGSGGGLRCRKVRGAHAGALSTCSSSTRVLPQEVVIHRLTGDGAKRDLIAPLWSADKKRVLNAIRAAFARDDLVQGSELNVFQVLTMRREIDFIHGICEFCRRMDSAYPGAPKDDIEVKLVEHISCREFLALRGFARDLCTGISRFLAYSRENETVSIAMRIKDHGLYLCNYYDRQKPYGMIAAA